jgi:AcrR family transcriptional regulator
MKAASRPNLLADESLPRQPRQARSAKKRARLKAAGLTLFGKEGYAQTSIADLALEAKVAVGGFYKHFHTKRQLLLSLMNDLLERLSEMEFRPQASGEVRANLRAFLARALATDQHYLGAYRAWQEAILSYAELARKEIEIRAWTTMRVETAFALLHQLPGARPGVDLASLSRTMDSFFWNLLAQAARRPQMELRPWVDSTTHLLYHALFADPPL